MTLKNISYRIYQDTTTNLRTTAFIALPGQKKTIDFVPVATLIDQMTIAFHNRSIHCSKSKKHDLKSFIWAGGKVLCLVWPLGFIWFYLPWNNLILVRFNDRKINF